MKLLISLVLSIAVVSSTAWAADAAAGKAKATACIACHGADGNSSNPIWPSLAGQNATYLVKQMKDFKTGARTNPTMQGMIAIINQADFADIAAYFSSQKIRRTAVQKVYIAPGQKLFRAGDAERKVPACGACHGIAGDGLASAGFPALAGQQVSYTIAQLKAFRDKTRTNDPNKMMRGVTNMMSDKQIEAVAHYVTGLHK